MDATGSLKKENIFKKGCLEKISLVLYVSLVLISISNAMLVS